jgi:hypothetical protein
MSQIPVLNCVVHVRGEASSPNLETSNRLSSEHVPHFNVGTLAFAPHKFHTMIASDKLRHRVKISTPCFNT